MKSSRTKRALVVGAGISGLTTAAALQRIGVEAVVFEAGDELRTTGSSLSIMSNGMAALKSIGLDTVVREAGQELRQFHIKTPQGTRITQFPLWDVGVKLGSQSVNIHRQKLHDALRQGIQGDIIRTGHRLTGFTQDSRSVTLSFSNGKTATGDFLVGADGYHSAVRERLLGKQTERPARYIAWLATVPFSHPVITPGYVGHYWGKGRRFGIVDIGHGEIYWWGTRNVDDPRTALRQSSRETILDTFQHWSPEIPEIIEATPECKIRSVHTRDRKPSSKWGTGRVTLVGDAAHPMLTSLGQGASQGIEDAIVLSQYLQNTDDSIPAALRLYENFRIPRANKVVALTRNVSKLEQASHPALTWLRNTYFRLLPGSVAEKQNSQLLTFQTPSINTG